MTLTEMLALVRTDLHDEDSGDYRWTDDVLERAIARAVKEFSEKIPYQEKATIATTSGSRVIDISTLTDRIHIEAVEYPVDQFPPRYQRFALWGDEITLLGEDEPEGDDCYVFYGKLHTLNSSTSTLPAQYEDLIAAGACGYAAETLGSYAINKINTGGTGTPEDWQRWAQEKLGFFRAELKRLGRRNRVRVRQLYTPYYPPKSQSTDWGP